MLINTTIRILWKGKIFPFKFHVYVQKWLLMVSACGPSCTHSCQVYTCGASSQSRCRFQPFPRLWWIQTRVSQSVCQPVLQRGVIHSFGLRDSKPSLPCPLTSPFFLPLSWAVLSLPFDLLPIWIFSPKGQLWDCIQHFYIATVCWLTLRGMQKWQTGGNGCGPICNFPLKWHVALFPHS